MVILPNCRCCDCNCPYREDEYPGWWAECYAKTIYATVTITYPGCDAVTRDVTLTSVGGNYWEGTISDALGSSDAGAANNFLSVAVRCCVDSWASTYGSFDCSSTKDWFVDVWYGSTVSGTARALIGCPDCSGGDVEDFWKGSAQINSPHCTCPEFSEYPYSVVVQQQYGGRCQGDATDLRDADVTVSLSYTP